MDNQEHKQKYDRALSLIESDALEAASSNLVDLINERTEIKEVYQSWFELMIDNPKFAYEKVDLSNSLETYFNNLILDKPELKAQSYVGRALCRYLRVSLEIAVLKERYLASSTSGSMLSTMDSVLNIDKKIEALPEFSTIRSALEESISDCEKAIEIDPELSPAYLLLSKIYTHLNQKKESQENFSTAINLGYELKIEDKKYAVENIDSITHKSTNYLHYSGHLVEYMAYPIAILLIMPKVSTLSWTGSIPSLLGWSFGMWLASFIFNILLIGIVILVISLTPANRDKRFVEVMLTKLKKILLLSSITIFASSFLSFLMISQLFATNNLYMAGINDHLYAGCIVSITVGALKNVVTLFKLYTTKNIKLKVTAKNKSKHD